MSAEERAVLGLLMEHHPSLLSVDEVVRALTADSDDFAKRDSIEVGVRLLVEKGLAHRIDRFVFASMAAVWMRRLDVD